jgi:hypothetical protein
MMFFNVLDVECFVGMGAGMSNTTASCSGIRRWRHAGRHKMSRDAEAGFAQVLVLASLAVVGAILTVALTTGAQTNRYSLALDLQLRGGAIARSGIELIIGAIEQPADTLETSLLAADTPYRTTISGIDTELEIQGEAGKLNPATADLTLIENYFAAAGIPLDAQAELLAALAQPRQEADGLAALRLVHAYLLPHLDLGQLRRDFGMWNTTAGIDPLFASRAVLAAVPDLGNVESLLQLRKTDPGSVRSLSRHFTESRGVFCLVATAHWAPDRIASHAEIVEITAGGRVLSLRRSCGH